ncbi:MAG: radical SAM protein [Planctomycetota bacterium]|jgi:MoaA/NifB/PqqE/SkfB family radical SAM enzyme|nr:radical SAM protein [Planctomycetota bacterium]
MASISKIKNYLMGKGMAAFLPALSRHSPETLIAMMDRMSRVGIEKMTKEHKGTPEDLERRIDAARGFFEMAKRAFPRLSKGTQRRLAFNFFFNTICVGDEVRETYRAQYGETPPFFLLMSPSMACDLRCPGCYAWKYPKDQSLSREKVAEIIREARDDMGIYFIAVTGGEPTCWPPLEEIAAEFDDVFFMVYTHGQRIDKAMAKRFAELGNIYPAVSIEGDEVFTDARRGEGAYKRVLEAMDNLRDAGVLFGYSLTHTRQNHDVACSGEFMDTMIGHGAAFGWVFQYIPIGRDPDLSLVPTGAQRVERRERILAARKNKPLLVFDFWNDGDSVDGCIAWGRKYLHITARGYVEPCVFVHFAKDSIHEKSLGECVRSTAFREMRERAPFHEDRRLPCPQIDHPHILRELVDKHGMFPTHDGAEDIIGNHFDFLCQTANSFAHALAESDRRQAHCRDCAVGATCRQNG